MSREGSGWRGGRRGERERRGGMRKRGREGKQEREEEEMRDHLNNGMDGHGSEGQRGKLATYKLPSLYFPFSMTPTGEAEILDHV